MIYVASTGMVVMIMIGPDLSVPAKKKEAA